MRVAAAVLKLKEKRIIKTCATAQNSARCADFCVLQNFKKCVLKMFLFMQISLYSGFLYIAQKSARH